MVMTHAETNNTNAATAESVTTDQTALAGHLVEAAVTVNGVLGVTRMVRSIVTTENGDPAQAQKVVIGMTANRADQAGVARTWDHHPQDVSRQEEERDTAAMAPGQKAVMTGAPKAEEAAAHLREANGGKTADARGEARRE